MSELICVNIYIHIIQYNMNSGENYLFIFMPCTNQGHRHENGGIGIGSSLKYR